VLDLIGWDVGMSLLAATLLVVGALIISLALSFIGDVTIGWEWAPTAVAAVVGGWIGSEALGAVSTWGPEFEGLFIVPALIGGLVFGIAMDAVLRFATRGSYIHHPQPI
jgi:hypothetical protein